MRVYTFGEGAAEGSSDMLAQLGGKGAGLAGMCRLGLSVPPGFTIPTEVCAAFFGARERLPDAVWPEIDRGLAHIEALRGLRFGDPEAPLLVSVRSGAAITMPGMMDTVLDLGLDEASVEGLGRWSGSRRFALDCHRRFLEMYSEVVLGEDAETLAELRDAIVEEAGVRSVGGLDATLLGGLVAAYRGRLGDRVPTDPRTQLREAIGAVFRSWNTRRAVQYRRQHGIDDGLGTAVTVQAMVFGNLGPDSATGVAFSRCPNTGERRLFGEYVPDAQGEDVVNGRQTPSPIEQVDAGPGLVSLQEAQPAAYAELRRLAELLEDHFRDVQDIEFTIERGRVWMLQTREAKRAARAAVRIAVEMSEAGLLTRDEALGRVEPARLHRLLHPSVDVHTRRRVIGRGLPASPGAVSGVAIFDPDQAVARAAAGERVILIRNETSTEDLVAMRAAEGILTARGGMTSHAALVARGMGRCCITGCADIIVHERAGRLVTRDHSLVVEAGTWLTLDGTTGEVILGEVATSPADPPAAFHTLMRWADERRRLSIRGNADGVADAEAALARGAEGIGLCRTEHMFLDPDRIAWMREMVLADDERSRRAALDRILPVQREDFRRMFSVMDGRPVAIRLLDLPLHEFLSDERSALEPVADRLRTPLDVLAYKVRMLKPQNPVLGHRGCRLGLTFPEIYEVQVRALVEAALDVGSRVELQIVVPMVVAVEEMSRLRRRIRAHATRVCEERQATLPPFTVGPMIEVPRACVVADQLAAVSDFFLFGTNDLTITTFGTHRDDASRFLPFYLENEILPADPFVTLDQEGVGALVAMAVERGRRARPGLICGLTGGQMSDPRSVEFCERLGLDYVSCPPHHVPVARLAAAQATIAREGSAG